MPPCIELSITITVGHYICLSMLITVSWPAPVSHHQSSFSVCDTFHQVSETKQQIIVSCSQSVLLLM